MPTSNPIPTELYKNKSLFGCPDGANYLTGDKDVNDFGNLYY